MRICTMEGYTVWKQDGFYGITKDTVNICPHCAYKYVWVVLQQKGI